MSLCDNTRYIFIVFDTQIRFPETFSVARNFFSSIADANNCIARCSSVDAVNTTSEYSVIDFGVREQILWERKRTNKREEKLSNC